MDQDDSIDIAEAHHRAGRIAAAAGVYRRLIAHNPRHIEAHKLLAIALFQMGDLPGAEQAARAAFALKPSSIDAANILAAILARSGRSDEAVDILHGLGARIARFPGVCLTLARALAELDRRDEAAAAVRRALARDPHSEEAREMLAAFENAAPVAARG